MAGCKFLERTVHILAPNRNTLAFHHSKKFDAQIWLSFLWLIGHSFLLFFESSNSKVHPLQAYGLLSYSTLNLLCPM